MAAIEKDDWEDVPSGREVDDWQDIEETKPPSDYGTLGNIAAGIMKGPGLGEYIPVVGPAIKSLGQRAGALTEGLFSDEDYDTRLKNIQARDESERQKYEREYPAAANVKSFAGASMLPLGAAANKLLPTPEAATTFAKYLYGAGRGALNALESGAVAGSDQSLRGNTDQAIPAAKDAAKYSAGFSAALGGIKGAGDFYARFMAGLRPETIDRYIKRRPQINSIEEDPLVQEASESIATVRNRAADMKEDVMNQYNIDRQSNRDMARLETSRLRDKAKEKRTAIDQEYQTNLLNEKAATQAAKNKAISEVERAKANNLERASKLEREGAEDISDMMRKSGRKIGEASGAALSALDKHKDQIPLAWYKGKMTKAINANKFGKTTLPHEGVDMLQKYRSLLDDAGVKSVPASQMKKLIQSLDADLATAYANAQNGNYNTPAIKSLMAMRRLASARLKSEVPGYKEAMEPVASMVSKIKGLQKDIPNSDPDKIMSKVKGVDGPGKASFRERLSTAENEFGGKGLSKLDEAQRLRSLDPADGQTFETPNQHFLDYLKQTKGKGIADLDKALAKKQGQVESARRLKETAIVAQAKDRLKPSKSLQDAVSGLTEGNIQQRIRNMGGNPPAYIKLREKMDKLGDLSGKEPGYYTQAADDLAVKRAMEGTFIRGSRNTNMARDSVKGLAEALNLDSQATGALGSIGAILGGATDIIGPKAVKVVIDMAESGAGKAARAALRRAALAGPQAVAQEHARLLREDPEYRAAYEAAGE